ncbi:DNRLRE domain-containing protein [Pyxidicoccus sp. 3LFB2]
MISKQWSKGLGLLPALGLMVGCGAEVDAQSPVDTPVETRSVEAAAVTPECKPVTYYRDTTVTPSFDTHAVQDSAGTNHGGATRLISDGSPRQDVYLRFDFHDPASIVQARLRLYATDGSTDGPAVYATTTSGWTESTLTWSNRPAPTGAALANVGAITSGSWVEYDVTAALNGTDELAFVLVPDGGNGVDFVSKEDANSSLRPRLVITQAFNECTYQGAGGYFISGRHYGGTGNELAQAIATDYNGVVVAGVYTGSGSLGGTTFPSQGGVMLGRYRSDGSHEWSRAYPQPAASVTVTDVALTPLGNSLMVGWYTGTPDFGTGPLPTAPAWPPATFIAKFSPSGSITWAKGFTAYTPDDGELFPSAIYPNDVATDANGSLIVTGYFFGYADLGGGPLDAGPSSRASEANAGLFLAKFSWEGNHLWSRAYPAGYEPTVGDALATDSAGNVLLGGAVSRPDTNTSGRSSPFVAKFSPSGSELWFRTLNGAVGSVTGVAALPGDAVGFAGHFGGAFTFAGQTVDNSDGEQVPHWETEDIMMGVLEASGADRWARARGTENVGEYVRELEVDGQGSFTLLGSINGVTDLGGGELGTTLSDYRQFVARYMADGAYRWARTLDPDLDAQLLSVGSGGMVFVGGSFTGAVEIETFQFGPSRQQDVVLLKLSP